MHFMDLASMNVSALSLLELRAVVGCLPERFQCDTVKGEKQAWATSFVEALRSMVEKESKGSLLPAAERHLCYSGDIGPFDPTLPLEHREAVKPAPFSGADAVEDAAVAAFGRVAERQTALREAGIHGVVAQPDEALGVPHRRAFNASRVAVLRERRPASTEGESNRGSNGLVSAVAAAAAARNARRGGAEEL